MPTLTLVDPADGAHVPVTVDKQPSPDDIDAISKNVFAARASARTSRLVSPQPTALPTTQTEMPPAFAPSAPIGFGPRNPASEPVSDAPTMTMGAPDAFVKAHPGYQGPQQAKTPYEQLEAYANTRVPVRPINRAFSWNGQNPADEVNNFARGLTSAYLGIADPASDALINATKAASDFIQMNPGQGAQPAKAALKQVGNAAGVPMLNQANSPENFEDADTRAYRDDPYGTIAQAAVMALLGVHGIKGGDPVPGGLRGLSEDAPATGRYSNGARPVRAKPLQRTAVTPTMPTPQPFIAPSDAEIGAELGTVGQGVETAPSPQGVVTEPAPPIALRPAGPLLRDHPELPEPADHTPFVGSAAKAIGAGADIPQSRTPLTQRLNAETVSAAPEPAVPLTNKLPEASAEASQKPVVRVGSRTGEVKPVAPPITEWKPIGNDTYAAPGGFHVSGQEGGGYEAFGPQGRLDESFKTPGEAIQAISTPKPTAPEEPNQPKLTTLATEANAPRIGMDQDELKAKAAEYAGSIRVPLTGLNDEQMGRVHETAQRLGLNDKTPATDDAANEMAKSLNLSYDDMRGRPLGHVPVAPEGVAPDLWAKAWVRTVKGLHDQSEIDVTDTQNAVRDAEDSHAETNPDHPEIVDTNQKYAAASDNRDLMTLHRDAIADVSGTMLQAHVAPSFAIRGEGVRQGLLDAPKFDEPKPSPKAKTTTSKSGNLVRKASQSTDAEFTAAVDRMKARTSTGGLKGLAKQFVSGESGHFDIDQLSDVVKDAVIIGKHYLKNGVSKFNDWRAAVEQHTGGMDEADAQYVYQVSQAARTKEVDEKQQSALKPIFVTALSNNVGPTRAAQIMHDVGPEVRNKLVKGLPLAGHEDDIFNAFEKNKPAGSTPKPTHESMEAVRQLIKDAPESVARRKAAAAKAAATRKANAPGKVQGPLSHDAAFEKMVSAKVKGGIASGKGVRVDMDSDALGQSAKAKLMNGENLTAAEERRLGAAIDKYKRTTPTRTGNDIAKQLTKTVSDYRAGRIGYDNPKEAVREQLMRYAKGKGGKPDPAKVAAIARDLAPVGDHDYEALASVLNKHSLNPGDWLQQYILGNILSGPETAEKIMVAHPATISAEELRRFMSDPEESRAGVKYAMSQAKTNGMEAAMDAMKHGPAYRQMSGQDVFHQHGTKLQTEQSRLAKPVLRLHNAYYQFMGEYNYARGMHNEAWQEATQKGLTGDDRTAYVERSVAEPSRVLQQKALEFAQEESQVNRNVLADKTRDMFSLGGRSKAGRAIGNLVVPVLGMPLNAVGRGIEMATGSFMSKGLANIYKELHPMPKGADPVKYAAQVAKYQQKVLQRGRIGAGLMAVGGIGGATGVLNPINAKKGRYTTSINMMGKEVNLPAGNIGAIPGMGVSAVNEVKKWANLPPDQRTAQNAAVALNNVIGTKSPLFADVPYARTMDTANTIKDYFEGAPGSSKPFSNAVASTASEVTPYSGALRNFAHWTDPLHAVRGVANPTPFQSWEKGIPGLLEKQPPVINWVTGKPYDQEIGLTRPQEKLTPEQQSKVDQYQNNRDAIAKLAGKLMQKDPTMSETYATTLAKRYAHAKR